MIKSAKRTPTPFDITSIPEIPNPLLLINRLWYPFTQPVAIIAYHIEFRFFGPPDSGTYMYPFAITISIHTNTLFVFGLIKDNGAVFVCLFESILYVP